MSLRCISWPSIYFGLLATALILPSAVGQTPSQQPASMPAATPAPASSLPSISSGAAATPAQTVPPATSQPAIIPPVQTVQVPTPVTAASLPSYNYDYDDKPKDKFSSTYIPLDSWVYPAAMRLYSLGYLDTSFITMRPWTRRSLQHMLEATQEDVVDDEDSEAMEILVKLQAYVSEEQAPANMQRGTVYGIDTGYTRLMGIGGPTLRDSYHLGQTIANDYGRPYQTGFNEVTGFSTVSEMGPFSLYVRGEYQHAPGGAGYSQAMSNELTNIDGIPYSYIINCVTYPNCPAHSSNVNQATIPAGPIAAQNPFRLMEATLSAHLWGHEISGGKSDDWFGPGAGGGMAWSNNAENIYSFRINRVEPLYIPLFSRLFGPVRYDFFVGSLKGHTYPNDPWVHNEEIELHPTANFQFGFQRTVIWGGHGINTDIGGNPTPPPGIIDDPITIHTFLKTFFSLNDTGATSTVKGTPADPGARFSTFNFSWRLPFFLHSVTLYTDSLVHDDVSPPSAPRRAGYRPGIYLSEFPHFHKLDLRVEAASTDVSTLISLEGQANYFEYIQRQGYTNKGFIMGDQVGREAKMGQAWLTYHLSGNEWVQLQFMHKKTPKDFVPGGTSQTQFQLSAVKRFGKEKNIELNAYVQFERWMAPVPQVAGNNSLAIITPVNYLYYTTPQHDTVATVQVTWYPRLHTTAPDKDGKKSSWFSRPK